MVNDNNTNYGWSESKPWNWYPVEISGPGEGGGRSTESKIWNPRNRRHRQRERERESCQWEGLRIPDGELLSLGLSQPSRMGRQGTMEMEISWSRTTSGGLESGNWQLQLALTSIPIASFRTQPADRR